MVGVAGRLSKKGSELGDADVLRYGVSRVDGVRSGVRDS
jgi:hypothetical protein